MHLSLAGNDYSKVANYSILFLGFKEVERRTTGLKTSGYRYLFAFRTYWLPGRRLTQRRNSRTVSVPATAPAFAST